jgi:hypothetical protein
VIEWHMAMVTKSCLTCGTIVTASERTIHDDIAMELEKLREKVRLHLGHLSFRASEVGDAYATAETMMQVRAEPRKEKP